MATKMSAIKGRLFLAFPIQTFKVRLSILLKNFSSFNSHFKRFKQMVVKEHFERIWTRQIRNVIYKPSHQRIILFLIWQLNRSYVEWLSKPNPTLSYELSCKSIPLHAALLQANPRRLSYPRHLHYPGHLSYLRHLHYPGHLSCPLNHNFCTVELFSCKLLQSCSMWRCISIHWRGTGS